MPGTFAEVVPGVDEVSRSFLARLDLSSAPALKIGMLGQVRFAAGQRRVLAIPAEAVVRRGQLDTVFLAANGRAQLRLVQIGRAHV